MNELSGYVFSSLREGRKKYDTGATDAEIKIGNIMPYSGPLSAYALIGRTEAAFFKKLNDEGGINGRKISFVSYDDVDLVPQRRSSRRASWSKVMMCCSCSTVWERRQTLRSRST